MVEIGNRIESADKYGYYHAILADGDIYISKTEYNYRMNQLEGRLDKSNTKRAELEAQLAAAQERNVALQSEHLNHVNALHEQLTAMTAERDSESRWAKHYSDKVTELEQQLAAMQRIIDSYLDSFRRII